MKRFFSLLLTAVLVLSMVPVFSLAATETIVYMDPVAGSNTGDGTEASPVKTFSGAYGLLQSTGGKLVLLNTVNITTATTLPSCTYPVTITSKTGAEGIAATANINISGPTTFENMTLTMKKASTATFISGNGHKLTMGEGLTCVPFTEGSNSYYFCLLGGNISASATGADLTIRSGHYRNVYAAAYTRDLNGNASLVMTGGTAAVVTPGYSGGLTGDLSIRLSGSATVTTVYAGAWTKNNVGNVTVTLGQGAVVTNLYSAGNGTGNVTSTTVVMDGYDQPLTVFSGKGGASYTGTLGTSTLVLKSGTLLTTPTGFNTVNVDIPQGKKLILGTDLSFNNLKSAGTLSFQGAVQCTAKTVSGSVSCTLEGAALKNQAYITAPAGSAISFPAATGIVEKNGVWVNHDPKNFAGLVLKAPTAVTMKLYTKLWARGDASQYTVISPYMTETKDGYNYYYYPNLQGGYHVRASRDGYIGVYKNIYMSAEEAAAHTVEEIVLEKKATNGFVPQTIYSHTTEVLSKEDAWKSEAAMYPKYENALDIPVFESGRPAHQMTTQEELWADITAQDKENDDMYVFTLCKSAAYGYDLPLVIFTKDDLSTATTMEEAAALMNKDRLTVYYRAQMHGNEPAAGEGALAMIHHLQDGYAEQILDNINLIIVPRLNPDGAYLYQRLLPNQINPNRDQMRIESAEMYAFQKGFMLFEPHVVLDGHERVWNNSHGDIQITAAFTPMNSDAYRDLALAVDKKAFEELEANDLHGFYYAANISGYDPNMGSGYYPVTGTSMYVLMESRGIYGGNESMERRAVAHMAAVSGILNYFHENAEQVKTTIRNEGKRTAENGKTYNEDNVFVLDTNVRKTTAADKENWPNLITQGQYIDWGSGTVSYVQTYPNVDDVVKRTRVLPTAYVLSANCPGIRKILKLMDEHGISYTYLPQGATLSLQRYGGSATEATLSAQRSVRFPEGCYVFTMNQQRGLLLAAFMEPDHTNAAEFYGNLVQMNLLSVSDTYRYVKNLNSAGTVDYTVTDATFMDLTVYLDGTKGSDTNNGLTEAAAVKTLEKAYAVMEEAMSGASADSLATLVVIGLYDLGAQQVHLPAMPFHVTITGKTNADGFNFIGGNTQDLRTFEIHSDTTFENMRLHINNTQSYNFLIGNGHKLVLGEGLNTTTDKANCYFTVAGGAYGYGVSTATTDLTVLSGTWRTIYGGGYRAVVTGHAKANISGCRVYQNIAPTYLGSLGSLEMTVSNVVVEDTVSTSAIYAAPITTNATYKTGSVLGDVTLTLGENITAQAVYMASRETGSVEGTVRVIANGVDLSKVPVKAVCPTTTGTVGDRVLVLGKDITGAVTLDSAVPVDLNGHNITGNVTVDGTLSVMDSQTDDFTVADGVYGKITGTVTGTLAAAKGYVCVDGTSFHRLALGITRVAIRPSVSGMYYAGIWHCDEVLAARIDTFGVAMSTAAQPEADFRSNPETLWTSFDGKTLVSGTEKASAILSGILKDGEDNDSRGKMPVYAAAYAICKDGTVIMADQTVAYSLYDVMHMAEETAYSQKLADFYNTWEDTMKNWDFLRLGK